MSATLRPEAAIRRTSSAVTASPIRSGAIVSVSRWMAANFSMAWVRARANPAARQVLILADVDDQEHGVEPARFHLGEVDLGAQARGVVALAGEDRGVDVDVGVEGDHAIVDRARSRCVNGLKEQGEKEHWEFWVLGFWVPCWVPLARCKVSRGVALGTLNLALQPAPGTALRTQSAELRTLFRASP